MQNLIVNINIKRSINVIDTTIKYIKKDLMLKKKRKSKLQMIFFINKETLNTQMFKKDENNTQLTLHRNVINEFFENNY